MNIFEMYREKDASITAHGVIEECKQSQFDGIIKGNKSFNHESLIILESPYRLLLLYLGKG